MFGYLINKAKALIVTIRFSILAIFITFFLITILSLVTITYWRFSTIINYVSIQFMKKASEVVFDAVIEELHDVEIESGFGAKLFEKKVVDPKNQSEILEYAYHFLRVESKTLPSVQSVFWGDELGNFTFASKEENNDISVETIDKLHSFGISSLKDAQERTIETHKFTDLTYDPRMRPWYTQAKVAKKTIPTDIYESTYRHASKLGITVSTPVYKEDGQLVGVFALNLRLDYIRRFIEDMSTTPRGVIFIVSTNGKLIAFPKLPQASNMPLRDIHSLAFPWVVESFDRYTKTGEAEFMFNSNHERYLATYEAIPSFGENHWLIAVVIPQSDFTSELQKNSIILVGISLFVLLIAIFCVSRLVTIVVKPIKNLVKEADKIKQFKLDNNRVRSNIKEIIALSNAIYSMKKGLRSFQRYVPATLVRQLIETGEDARVGGAKKQLAIMFTDIKDFTSISERENPDELMIHVCDYLDELTQIIISERGTIDKYIGDSIMAFWGAPLPENEPCEQAAIAALRCVHRLHELNTQWVKTGKPAFYTRIGIHLGDAIVGNLGSTERLNYTAIGDAINIASRLEGVNKLYNTQIIVSDAVYQVIKDKFALRMLDCVIVKGRTVSHYIYELLAEDRTQLSFDLDAYSLLFAKGFSAYQQRQWDEAFAYFAECLHMYSEDVVAPIFMNRCQNFKSNPPPEDWKGVLVISEK